MLKARSLVTLLVGTGFFAVVRPDIVNFDAVAQNVISDIVQTMGVQLNTSDFNGGVCFSGQDAGNATGYLCSQAAAGLLPNQTMNWTGLNYTILGGTAPQLLGAPLPDGDAIQTSTRCNNDTDSPCNGEVYFPLASNVSYAQSNTLETPMTTADSLEVEIDIAYGGNAQVNSSASPRVPVSIPLNAPSGNAVGSSNTAAGAVEVAVGDEGDCFVVNAQQIPFQQNSSSTLSVNVTGGVMASFQSIITLNNLDIADYRLLRGALWYIPASYIYNAATGGGLSNQTGFAEPPSLNFDPNAAIINGYSLFLANQTVLYQSNVTFSGQFYENSATTSSCPAER